MQEASFDAYWDAFADGLDSSGAWLACTEELAPLDEADTTLESCADESPAPSPAPSPAVARTTGAAAAAADRVPCAPARPGTYVIAPTGLLYYVSRPRAEYSG